MDPVSVIEADAMRAVGWIEGHLPHHHQTSAEPSAAAVTIKRSNPGGPVSFFADLKADADALAGKLRSVDENALNALEAILANPKTAEAFSLIASVSHVDPGPYFDGAIGILKVVAGQPAAVSGPQPSFQPAGPTVAGQA